MGAQSVDDLSTLVAAVVAGDLVETLSSPGPFTVFAPTNEAFGALPEGTLDTLLKPENKDQLVDILTYHVLPAQVLSTDLQPKQIVKTLKVRSFWSLFTKEMCMPTRPRLLVQTTWQAMAWRTSLTESSS